MVNEWIPCSERLPERGEDTGKYSDNYRVTVETANGPLMIVAYYCFMNSKWYRTSDDREQPRVIAWRPRV